MFSKILTICLCMAFIEADVVLVKNGNSKSLVVSVTGQSDVTIASSATAMLLLEDGWSGSISALPVDAEVTDGPKTKVELTLGTESDSYDVSLVDGFNYAAKIIPTGSEVSCEAALCMADLRAMCPTPNQVTDSAGNVVACSNSPILMATVCPKAVVTESDTLNVKSCNSSAYMIVLS